MSLSPTIVAQVATSYRSICAAPKKRCQAKNIAEFIHFFEGPGLCSNLCVIQVGFAVLKVSLSIPSCFRLPQKHIICLTTPPHAWFSAWPGILCHGPECQSAGWFLCHPLRHPRAKSTQSCRFRFIFVSSVPTFGQLQSHDSFYVFLLSASCSHMTMWVVYRNLNSEISALKSLRGSAALWNCLSRLQLHQGKASPCMTTLL